MIQLIAGFAIGTADRSAGRSHVPVLSDDDRILLFVVLLLVQFTLVCVGDGDCGSGEHGQTPKGRRAVAVCLEAVAAKLQAHWWPLALGGMSVVGLVGYLVVEMPGVIPDAKTPIANTTAHAVVAEAPAEALAAMQVSTAEPFIRKWAKAWETGQTDFGRDHGSPGFTPEDAMPRNQWEKLRRQRVDTAKQIVIEILDLTVTPLNGNRAEAVFTQHYTSKSYKDISRKTLTMEYG
ncbi:hypothetical protein [Candidatus Aalborgicola defluviihabitans]|uniref:L,D-transpeptidase Cds6 family protein n=1 Tax=Candidatus Aalborgicola defluviihabitans TaxID=3386187 RepID=UPI001DF5F829|nr:hypothetical protein [Burkholderiales bacterium]